MIPKFVREMVVTVADLQRPNTARVRVVQGREDHWVRGTTCVADFKGPPAEEYRVAAHWWPHYTGGFSEEDYAACSMRSYAQIAVAAGFGACLLALRRQNVRGVGSGPGGMFRFGDDWIPTEYVLLVDPRGLPVLQASARTNTLLWHAMKRVAVSSDREFTLKVQP